MKAPLDTLRGSDVAGMLRDVADLLDENADVYLHAVIVDCFDAATDPYELRIVWESTQ